MKPWTHRDPSNVENRWKVVEAALDSKQIDAAHSVAQAGLAVNPGHPLSWVMAGVVEQHFAETSGGPSDKAGVRAQPTPPSHIIYHHHFSIV
jgi:hypothetical protein